MEKVMNCITNSSGSTLTTCWQDWVCKTVMTLQLYAMVASIGWMFVQGYYLHSRVTTNVFTRGKRFKAYFWIGWGELF